MHCAHDVDLKTLTPAHIIRAHTKPTHIRHDNVKAPECGARRLYPGFECHAIAHINGLPHDHEAMSLERRHGSANSRCIPGADTHVTPLVGEFLSDGTANATSATRDERLLPLESQAHALFLLKSNNGITGLFSWINTYRRRIFLRNLSARSLDGSFS